MRQAGHVALEIEPVDHPQAALEHLGACRVVAVHPVERELLVDDRHGVPPGEAQPEVPVLARVQGGLEGADGLEAGATYEHGCEDDDVPAHQPGQDPAGDRPERLAGEELAAHCVDEARRRVAEARPARVWRT